MVRFLRFPKLLCAALVGATFALAFPAAASADHWRPRPHFDVWLPFPPPPPFFFRAPRFVHRHGPYCNHRYDGYERRERYERHDDRHERWERRRDHHERW
jgi:hypothetical protein